MATQQQRPGTAMLPSAIKTGGMPSSPYATASQPYSPTARTPGTDSWNIEAFAPEEPDKATMRSTMRSRKARIPPPTWLVNSVAPPTTMDTSGPHMKAHIQSLAKLDKEELAEKLFHTKMALGNLEDKNKLAQVENRKLEASLAKSTACSGSAATQLYSTARTTAKSLSPGRGKRAAAADIVRNLKSKNKQLRAERDRALNMVAHLQRAPRVAKLQELQAQVGLLTGEIANQMALRQCATGDQSTLRRTASPMSPFPQSRGFRPASCPPGDTSKRRLTEVLQELYMATKPLQQEAQRLRDACGALNSGEFASEPQYRAAAKVHSFLVDHVITMADHMSNMPCAEELTIALRGMGFAEQQVYTRQHADNALDQATNQMMQGTPPSVILQGSTLAGTLASLAAPLATIVAQLEALSTQELEEDSWLREGASKVSYLAQKLVEACAFKDHTAAPAALNLQEHHAHIHSNKEVRDQDSVYSEVAGTEYMAPWPLPEIGDPRISTHLSENPAVLPAVGVSSSQRQSQQSQPGATKEEILASCTSSLAQHLHSKLSAASIASNSRFSSGAGAEKSAPASRDSANGVQQGAGYVNHEQNGLDIALAPEAEEIADTVEEMETPTVQPDKAGMVDVVEDTPRGLFQSPPEAVALSALSVGGIPDAAAEAASETVAPHTSNPAVSDSPAIVVADIDRSVADSEEQPEVDMVMPVEDTSADAGSELAAQPSLASAGPSAMMSIDINNAVSDAMAHAMSGIPEDLINAEAVQEVAEEATPTPPAYPEEPLVAAASIKTESEGPKSRTSLADVEPLALTARVPDVDDLFTTAHSPQGGAGAKMFPIASEPSLAASELCAVDSTLDHLMSIEETVSEVAFQSNPTPEPGQQSTVEKAVGESGRRASDVSMAAQRQSQMAESAPLTTQDTLGSHAAEEVLGDMVDDLSFATRSIDDA